jgi:hypothetical protein
MKKNGKIIFADGAECWYFDGLLHREDGPAFIRSDGSEIWYREGVFHREDGPAIIMTNNYKEWWLNGIRINSKEIFWEKISDEAKLRIIFNSIDDLEFF